MRTVTLTGTEVVTSKLGFGCSALIGGRSRTEALRLLEAAYDSDIRHFDVARVYGTGDAEDVLGEFASGRGSNITIATKFGINPTPSTLATGVAKSLVRFAARRSRRALHLARRYGRWAIRGRGQFTPDAAKTSLMASLTKLRTE
jgi:D-threo-aldose 1-dehydrogenase